MERNPILDKAILDFDLQNFLDENSIDYTTNSKNVGSNWIGISPCIFCGDSRYHGGLNLEYKAYNCWACGNTTNIIGFISKIKNISYNNAKQFIINGTLFDEDDIEIQVLNILNNNEVYNNIEKQEYKEIKLPESIPITSYMIKNNPIIKNFFDERKLTSTHVYQYNLKIGVSSYIKGQLVIPIVFKKKLVAYQTRKLNFKIYKNNGPIKHFLFDYDKIHSDKKIVLVEGFLDFVRAKDFFYKFYGNEYEVTTGFSKIITDEQIRLLQTKNPKKIIYMMDKDAWFEYNKTCHKIITPTDFIILPEGDPGDLTEKRFLQVCMENKL